MSYKALNACLRQEIANHTIVVSVLSYFVSFG